MSTPVPPPRGPRDQPGYSADLHMELYQRTGEFFHLMGAFVAFVETGRPIPDCLLLAIHSHFRRAVNTDAATVARESLGVAEVAHWREYKRTQRAMRLLLLRELGDIDGQAAGSAEIRRTAAMMLHGNPGSIKTEYYQDLRSDAPLGDIAISERFIQWASYPLNQCWSLYAGE